MAKAGRLTARQGRARVLFPQARYLTRQERLALNAYKSYLVRKLRGRLEHVILYGSKARGDSNPDSDLDVLVVVNGDEIRPTFSGEGLWPEIVSPDLDLYEHYGVFLAPLVMSADEFARWTPLLADIRRDGIELYRRSGLESLRAAGGWDAIAMHKAEHVAARMAMAREKLDAARSLIPNRHPNDAISLAYYAMFYASKALLLQLGVDPHKHTIVANMFQDQIARVGLSDPKYGHVLQEYMKLRLDADYEVTFRATQEQAEGALHAAKEFVGEAEKTLKRLLEQEKQDDSKEKSSVPQDDIIKVAEHPHVH